jgi:hypothetical protein
MSYINKKVFGLPKPLRKGGNTRIKHALPAYIHKIKMNGSRYFKVHLKRQGKSKIKYFKTLGEAEMFVELLRLHPYL